MAEVFVKVANYSMKKKELEERRMKTVRNIEEYYRPRIETIENRYKDVIDDIERRELKNYRKNFQTFVSPLLHLKKWLDECENDRLKNPLKLSILEESIEEYKNFPLNHLINLSLFLQRIRNKVEERVKKRLSYAEKNMLSQIEIENLRFKKEMEKLNSFLEKAKEISKDYGLELEIKDNCGVLISKTTLNFSTYLEKIVDQGINIRDWYSENKIYKVMVEKNKTTLILEYDNNNLFIYIPSNNEEKEYVELVEPLINTLRGLQKEEEKNIETIVKNSEDRKRKGGKLERLFNLLKLSCSHSLHNFGS